MKKIWNSWRNRRLKKWCVEVVMRGYTYSPDRLEIAEDLIRWMDAPISRTACKNSKNS